LQLAAVISASHNPYEDNGIKLFAADGFKLDDDTEHAIEAELDKPLASPDQIGRVRRFHGALEDYLRELHTRFESLDMSGLDVLLDNCANPKLLTKPAAEHPETKKLWTPDPLLLVSAKAPFAEPAPAVPDYDIPNGHFYTQANGGAGPRTETALHPTLGSTSGAMRMRAFA